MNIKIIQLPIITIMSLLLTSIASAHEMRHICAGGNTVGNVACDGQPDTLMFHVGFVNEPAWATDSNGANINISWHPDGKHDDKLTQNVDTSAGDKVMIHSVEVQYFGSKSKYHLGMKPKGSMMIYSDGHDSPVVPQNQPGKDGNMAQKFGTKNVYNAYFRPAMAGVYGYVIKGMVEHKDTNGTMHDFDFSNGLSFICGANGSQDTLTNTKYGCAQNELAFPSNGHDERSGKERD
jgi:hypothetical protein